MTGSPFVSCPNKPLRVPTRLPLSTAQPLGSWVFCCFSGCYQEGCAVYSDPVIRCSLRAQWCSGSAVLPSTCSFPTATTRALLQSGHCGSCCSPVEASMDNPRKELPPPPGCYVSRVRRSKNSAMRCPTSRSPRCRRALDGNQVPRGPRKIGAVDARQPQPRKDGDQVLARLSQ